MNLQADFEQWWQAFPRKVGKLAAQREYERARKRASAEVLLLGIVRYLQAKPEYADYCHPKTFLSQGRWLDEAPANGNGHTPWRCPHVVACGNPAACANATLLGRPDKVQAPA
jgi:hypothetical protein